MFKKFLLFILAVGLILVFAGKQPQMLAIPLGLLVYLSHNLIRKIFSILNVGTVYVLMGWLLGMCIEIFAIWQNMPLPIGDRKLFNQDPGADLLVAAGFYFVVSFVLYWFAKRYNFSKKAFIFVTAFYAIVIEQLGAVFVMGLANPFLWVYVAVVYATWTVAPYLLFKDRLGERPSPTFKIYVFLILSIWAASFVGSVLGTGLLYLQSN